MSRAPKKPDPELVAANMAHALSSEGPRHGVRERAEAVMLDVLSDLGYDKAVKMFKEAGF